MATPSKESPSRALSNSRVFLWLGCLTFLLYLPAIKAGWVIDAAGWLAHVRDKNEALIPYLNRSWSTVPGLYQLTQLVTLLFFKIWGGNVYAWSLLYEALHTLNAWLFFLAGARILSDSGQPEPRARHTAFVAALLFTVSPYISEVLVWKACFHYLQGFLLLFLSVHCFLAYIRTQRNRYAVLSAAIYFCAIFSLEIFYLTPVLLLILAIHYAGISGGLRCGLRRSIGLFVLPQILILGVYTYLFHRMYPGGKPHVYNLFSQSFTAYMSKGPKYLFHIVFLGRFFPYPIRTKVYAFCESVWGMMLCYGTYIYFVVRAWIRRDQPYNRVSGTLLLWSGATIVLLFPLAFPTDGLLVFYDRYVYVAAPIMYLLIAHRLLHREKIVLPLVLLGAYAVMNLYFAVKLNLLWKHSNFVVHRLLTEMPDAGKRTVLLLNAPDNMNGAAMIGSDPDGAFRMLRKARLNLETPPDIYEVLSYNLTGLHDAGRISVRNDSTLIVAFNQSGNWWTYAGLGARNYSNSEYSVWMRPRRNEYMLILKKPWSHYLLLNEVDGNWLPVRYDVGEQTPIDSAQLDTHLYDEWRLRDGEKGAYK